MNILIHVLGLCYCIFAFAYNGRGQKTYLEGATCLLSPHEGDIVCNTTETLFFPTKVITFLREESKAAFLFNLRHSALNSRQPLVWPPFFFFPNSHRLSPAEQTNRPQHETTQHTGLKISVRSILGRKKKNNNCGSGPPACLITSLILSPHICGLFNDINNSWGGGSSHIFRGIFNVTDLSLSAVNMTLRSNSRDPNTRRSSRKLKQENRHSKSTCSRCESEGRHSSITWEKVRGNFPHCKNVLF